MGPIDRKYTCANRSGFDLSYLRALLVESTNCCCFSPKHIIHYFHIIGYIWAHSLWRWSFTVKHYHRSVHVYIGWKPTRQKDAATGNTTVLPSQNNPSSSLLMPTMTESAKCKRVSSSVWPCSAKYACHAAFDRRTCVEVRLVSELYRYFPHPNVFIDKGNIYFSPCS